MDFKAGDIAVHPTHGVGSIVRREEKQLAGSALQPFYLLAIGTTMVWVPIGPDGSTTLRAVTAKRELDHCRKLLKSRPTKLEREHKQWRFDKTAQLTHGSFEVSCEVVRDLTSLGWYRPIGEMDLSMLQKVRGNLRREWAAASGSSLQEAILEMDALLLAGRTEFKTV